MTNRTSISSPDSDQPRFLFYSHDGMGLGHTRRNLAIAAALVDLSPGASVLLATGTDDAHRLGLPPRVEVLKLPGLTKTTSDDYGARRLLIRKEEIRHLRASLLEAAVNAFQPEVVLVDKHPFGASGEFRLGLERLKCYGGRVALGLRDILDDPERVREEWGEYQLQQRIAAFHDRLLVYGEKAVFDPISEYGLPPSVVARTRFCGYVVNRDDDALSDPPKPAEFSRASRKRPLVLATAGGGEDGFALLENFIGAAAGASWQGIAVAGPLTPDRDLRQLRLMASAARVTVHSFLPKLPTFFDGIDALVCMGGYNTLTEAASRAVPMVCVPRAVPRAEQLVRARAFEKLGLLRNLHPDMANPAALRAEVNAALSVPKSEWRARMESVLSFDGAHNAAEQLLELARAPARTDALRAAATH